MTPETTNQAPDQAQADKDRNFRALEQKYQRQLEQERAARMEAERIAQDLQSRRQEPEDDDSSDPYVDHRKLEKKLSKHGEQIKQQTQSEIQRAVHLAQEQARQETFLESNPDFYDTLQNNADKLMQRSPALAKSILQMPDNFERQKLVYQTIKEMGLDKPIQKEPSVQDKIDANRRSPYYQPSGVGSAPYASQGDFSPAGQKQAYDKMQELKNRMRLG